jgi:hypothetical protein
MEESVRAESEFGAPEMDEHQGSAPCIPVWKTGVYLSTPMLAGKLRVESCWLRDKGV